MIEGPFEGGCLCGSVRYSAQRLSEPGWCHCRQCQRFSGAPAMVWAAVETADFTVKGPVARSRSSAHAHRMFCLYCGASLYMADDREAGRIDIAVGSLDEPERVRPEYHIWDNARLGWFETTDQLPRHPEDL